MSISISYPVPHLRAVLEKRTNKLVFYKYSVSMGPAELPRQLPGHPSPNPNKRAEENTHSPGYWRHRQ